MIPHIHTLFEFKSISYENQLLRTPGPVPFGTCICSNVETILSWTCHVYGPFEFRTSLGTSILLQTLNIKKIYRGQIRFREYWIMLLQPNFCLSNPVCRLSNVQIELIFIWMTFIGHLISESPLLPTVQLCCGWRSCMVFCSALWSLGFFIFLLHASLSSFVYY